MPVSLEVIPKISEAEARKTAQQATKAFDDAGKQAGNAFQKAMGAAFGSGKDISRELDGYTKAFGRAADSAGKLKVAEEKLNEAREKGVSGSRMTAQIEKVESLRRAETRATREATAALEQYQVAAKATGSAASGGGLLASLRGVGGAAKSAGGEAASGFAEGIAGSSALARVGQAGGPIGIALAGAALLGFAVGKSLMGNITEGMKTLQVQDIYQARLAVDDNTMAQLGSAAAKAYAGGYGESLEANLSTLQLGIQGRLLQRGASDLDAQKFVEKTQNLATLTGEDPQAIVRGSRGLLDSGLVQNYTQAYDLFNAAQAKGLNLSQDLLDTAEEYGTKFRDIGLSGAEAFGLISQMVAGGARNVDVAADGLKEFAINASDGSKLTKQAFQALGFDADQMAQKFAEGGPAAHQATGEIIDALRQVSDPIQRQQIGLALFKTKWEDMGKAVGAADLEKAATELGDIDGAMDRSNDTMSKHINQWDLLSRRIDQAWSSMQKWLADSGPGKWATNTLPSFIGNTLFGNLDQQLQAARDAAWAAPPPPAPGQRGRLTTTRPGTTRITPVPIVPGADATTGAAAKPNFDPSQYSLDQIPIGKFPGVDSGAVPSLPMMNGSAGAPVPAGPGGYVVDPGAVYDAQTREMSARNSVEEARQKLLAAQADNTSTEAEIQSAKNDVIQAERQYISSQRELTETQKGTWKKANDAISGAMGDLNSIFAPLDQDFGISKGIPGIVENLVKTFGNMALGSAIGSSPTLQAGALALLGGNQSAATGGSFGFGAPVGGGQPYGLPGGTNTGGYGSGGKGIFPDWVQQLGAAFGVTPSTYSGHQESDRNEPGYAPNPGHENRGIDWTGSVENMQRFADYLSTIPGALEQVIWQNPNTGQTDTIAGGQPVSGYYDAGTLADHQNHVHTRQSASIPLPGGFGAAGYDTASGTVPVNVVNGPSALMNGGLSPQQWDKIAGAEAGGNWQTNTGNGFSGGLQFTPSTWDQFGGQQYAPQAWQATPDQQMAIGNNVFAGQGPGAWPATSAAHPEWFQPGAGPLPAIPAGAGGGEGFMGLGGPGPGPSGAVPGGGFTPGGTAPQGGGGAGFQLGGAAFDGAMMAAGGLDLLAPGAGQAAQVGIKLGKRAIEFGGQAAGIAASGVMETLLPSGSPLGNFGNSWFGKLAGGFAGARPAKGNLAGQGPPPLSPQEAAAKQGQGQQGGGAGQSAGQGITVHYTNQQATEDRAGADLTNHLSNMNQGPGR